MGTIIFYVLIISGIILFHELGHFIFAKRAGARVEEFGLGLPPRLFGIKKGETLYSINLLPIGAFVKVTGEGEMEEDSDPKSIQSKSWGKRFMFITGGVLFNFLLAFLLIFGGRVFGTPYSPLGDDERGDRFIVAHIDSEVKILELNLTESPANYKENLESVFSEDFTKTIISDYEEKGRTTFQINFLYNEKREESLKKLSEFRFLTAEEKVVETPAKKSEMEDTTEILGFYNEENKLTPILSMEEYSDFTEKYSGEVAKLEVKNLESGDKYTVKITPFYGEVRTGVAPLTIVEPGMENPIKALWETIKSFLGVTYAFFLAITGLFRDAASDPSVLTRTQSVVGIFEQFKILTLVGGAKFAIFSFGALISLNLAVFNLLPIPALDGGHVFFLLIEKLRGGKKLNPNVQGYINLAGFLVLISFILFITGRDIANIFS